MAHTLRIPQKCTVHQIRIVESTTSAVDTNEIMQHKGFINYAHELDQGFPKFLQIILDIQ